MYKKFIELLVCPKTKKSLNLIPFKEDSEKVTNGLLVTEDNQWYPIIDGIPYFLINDLRINKLPFFRAKLKDYSLPEYIVQELEENKTAVKTKELKHQLRNAESFAYEWNTIYDEDPDYEMKNFLHFVKPYTTPETLKDKIVLDAGCGSGRFTKAAARCNAKVVIGLDIGDTTFKAYQLNKDMDNVLILQADIYNPPFPDNFFDTVMSIGVLHHLPYPQKGFDALVKKVKPGGKMTIWVYSRRQNARAIYFYEPVRVITKKIPAAILKPLCFPPAVVVHGINYLQIGLAKIKLKNIATRIPFYYYADSPFINKFNDTFDVLATHKSNYYYKEDIEKWYQDASLQDVEAYEHQTSAGITTMGTKNI